MVCDVCGSELSGVLDSIPTNPEGGTWVTCGHCLATAIVMESSEVLRPPYKPTTDRWCAAVDESSTPEVEHAVVTTLTLCGVNIEQKGLTGYGYSWSPLRATACMTCRSVAAETDQRWPVGRRGRLTAGAEGD
jgi:hypothetical protein